MKTNFVNISAAKRRTPPASAVEGSARLSCLQAPTLNCFRLAFVILATLLTLVTFFTTLAQAGLREPDNVIYGSITLGGRPVTAAETTVIIEARRTLAGPPIASYQVGSERRFGGSYVLRITVETAAPLSDPLASLTGDALFIVVRDASGDRVNKPFSIGERG